jgi:hypothetical protein
MSVPRKLAIPRLEPTPREVFFDRRRFLAAAGAGIAGAALAAPSFAAEPDQEQILKPPLLRPGVFPAKRNDAYKLPRGPARRAHAATRRRHPQQLLRVPARSRRAGLGERGQVRGRAVEDRGGGRLQEADDARPRRAVRVPARGARLPLPLRRALGDERALERIPVEALLEQVEPTSKARFVRFESAARGDQMPGCARRPGTRGRTTRRCGWTRR